MSKEKKKKKPLNTHLISKTQQKNNKDSEKKNLFLIISHCFHKKLV